MSQSKDSILIVAGHAIWENNRWCGIESSRFSEDIVDAIESQVETGCRLMGSHSYDVLSFSGGHSRPDNDPPLLNSEAKGMYDFAEAKGWLPNCGIILEEFARDSFENVFYSLLLFHKEFKAWPTRVGVISMPHKSIRYMLMATGLKIAPTQFSFHEVGAVTPIDKNCINEMTNMVKVVDTSMKTILDPLLRAEYFEKKRADRTPRTGQDYLIDVKAAYGNGLLIDQVAGCDSAGGWQSLDWPWQQ